ncbi:MAG TPA: FHA domain-containing protein [Oceanobacillus sp.]|nr:FHA domain-containing protein [Oceanobacillus sp.]
MMICPYCAHRNREGFLFCEECGQRLGEGDSKATLPTRQFEYVTGEIAARATWGTSRFDEEAYIVMHIRDASEPVTLQPDRRTVLGRMDTNSPQQPDLDLTPFGALEKGVSRIHAAIYRNDDTLTIVDMGSANGTHLNGQRLVPDQPRVLRDGDEIRLGKLVAHIYFKT